jgi:hypothetical protein
MTDAPTFDQNEQQWLDFFDKGGRHDVAYNIQYLVDVTRAANSMKVAGRGVLSTAMGIGINEIQSAIFFAYFGGQVNPVVGVSAAGLHLPTVPVVRWSELAAVIVDNLRETWLRASNASMIPDPGVGGALVSTRSQITLLSVEGQQLKASINTPGCENAVMVSPTASGAAWGSVLMQLDPGLGAEQVVQLMYLITLMCKKNGVRIFHTGGAMGDIAADTMKKQILGMN